MWRILSAHRPRFTRQLVVGPYILDLACRSVKLAVELDGGHHWRTRDYDLARTEFLESLGWKVIRYWNSEVADNPEGIVGALDAWASGSALLLPEAVILAAAERASG